MPQICEITRKKIPHPHNLPKEEAAKAPGKRPALLKRRIEVPELKGSVRIKVSEEGLKVLKETGGLAKFLKSKEDQRLSTKLKRIKWQIFGPPKKEEPKAEAKSEAAPEEKAPEKAAAEAPPAKASSEAPAAEAKAAEAPKEEPKKEEPKTEEPAKAEAKTEEKKEEGSDKA